MVRQALGGEGSEPPKSRYHGRERHLRLQARHLEDWEYNATLSDAPQGGVATPPTQWATRPLATLRVGAAVLFVGGAGRGAVVALPTGRTHGQALEQGRGLAVARGEALVIVQGRGTWCPSISSTRRRRTSSCGAPPPSSEHSTTRKRRNSCPERTENGTTGESTCSPSSTTA